MNFTEKTIELLQIEPDFVIKNPTAYSDGLTVYDILSIIVEDGGETGLVTLFKGHTMSKIRQALADLFIDYPKKSHASEWYLHILAINGYKKCPSCTEIKLLNEFGRNKAMKSSNTDSWCLTCMKDYRSINVEQVKQTKALHQKNNPEQYAFSTAKRRAAKLRACPAWADLELIRKIYDNCPNGYHVDHWAPLQGENVCGLHTEFNLQYVEASKNISKGNKFSDQDTYYGY